MPSRRATHDFRVAYHTHLTRSSLTMSIIIPRTEQPNVRKLRLMLTYFAKHVVRKCSFYDTRNCLPNSPLPVTISIHIHHDNQLCRHARIWPTLTLSYDRANIFTLSSSHFCAYQSLSAHTDSPRPPQQPWRVANHPPSAPAQTTTSKRHNCRSTNSKRRDGIER